MMRHPIIDGKPLSNVEAELQLLQLRRVLIGELMGTTCRCGGPKNRAATFCRLCYYSLVPDLRSDLYKRIGEGYEDAYERACRVLDRSGRAEAATGGAS